MAKPRHRAMTSRKDGYSTAPNWLSHKMKINNFQFKKSLWSGTPLLTSKASLALKQLNDPKSAGVNNKAAENGKQPVKRGLIWCGAYAAVSVRRKNGHLIGKQLSFVPVLKNFYLKECAHHRTISSICNASKVLFENSHSKIENEVSARDIRWTSSLRGERGSIYQIVNIRYIIEKCREHKHPLCAL